MKQYIATSTAPPFRKKQDRNYTFTRTQKTDVYDAICDAGAQGATRAEIAKKVNLAPDRISFYLSDLRRAGYIAVLGDPTTVSATMNAEEAAFAAMLGLENALIAKMRENSRTPATTEQERSFLRYNLTKERALAVAAPGSSASQIAAQKQEAKVALRVAIIELVKLVF